jgi:uncharacterized protein YoxC
VLTASSHASRVVYIAPTQTSFIQTIDALNNTLAFVTTDIDVYWNSLQLFSETVARVFYLIDYCIVFILAWLLHT